MVLYGYAFRNALLPVVTTLGMVFPLCLGRMCWSRRSSPGQESDPIAVEALVVSDYAAVQGFVLAMALLFVILNLLIDLSYSLIDPRFGTSSK